MAAIARKILVVGIGIWALLMGGTWARADEPLPQRFNLGDTVAFRTMEREVQRAWEGDCEPLLKTVRPEELPPAPLDPTLEGEDWDLGVERRLFAAMEMHDRGLCIPFDPREATRLQRFLTYDYGHRLGAVLDYSTRAYLGRGMERDIETAEALVEHVLISWIPDHRDPGFVSTSWTGRATAPFAEEWWQWMVDAVETRSSRFDFAVDLVEGNLRRPDGAIVRPRPEIAFRLLNEPIRNPHGNYLLALLGRDGKLTEEGNRTWEIQLLMATTCGHVDAVYEFIDLLKSRFDRVSVSSFRAVAMLWVLEDEIGGQLNRIAELTAYWGLPRSRSAYSKTISVIENRPERCYR